MTDHVTAADLVRAGAARLDYAAAGWWRRDSLNLAALDAGDPTAVLPPTPPAPAWNPVPDGWHPAIWALPSRIRDRAAEYGLIATPGGPTATELAAAWATLVRARRANRVRCDRCGQVYVHAVAEDGQPVRLDPDRVPDGNLALDGDFDHRPTVHPQPGGGYTAHQCPTLPRPAAGLIAVARTHGWLYAATNVTTVVVNVQVGRTTDTPGRHWLYNLSWRSTDTGGWRLFTNGAETPDRPGHHDGPSLKAIRAVITANPTRGTQDGRP